MKNLEKPIVKMALDTLTIGVGTWMFVQNTLDGGYESEIFAGLGAFLVVLGLLIQKWMKAYLDGANKSTTVNPQKVSSKEGKNFLSIALAFLVGISLIGNLIQASHSVKQEIGSVEFKVQNVAEDIYDLENRMIREFRRR